MKCPEKSIVKYIRIVIKKLYLMFLIQTQPACAKSKHVIDCTQNSSSDSWNQASQK